MSDDQTRKKAMRALLDGKHKVALDLFLQLHESNPSDLRTYVKVAELREKNGDTQGAIQDYVRIARMYAEQGFIVQAISINKIILRLDPNRTEIKEHLKELSAERGEDWAVTTVTPTDKVTSMDVSNADKAKLSFERTPLLSGLSGEYLESFMDSLELKTFQPSSLIYKQGDPGDYLYLIGMGAVHLEVHQSSGRVKVFSRLGEGDCFGEHAFMSRSKRKDFAVAENEVSVLMIDRNTFDQWVKDNPAIHDTVETFYRQRVLARVLAITPVFEGVPEEARMELAHSFNTVKFSKGKMVVLEGDQGNSFFLIRSGVVRIVTKGMKKDAKLIELGRMGEGSFFGEVALLTEKPRTATVVADTDVELMELTRDKFDEIAAVHPSVRKVVEAYQKSRVKETIKALMTQEK